MSDDTDELVEVYSRYLDERIELLAQLYRERKKEEALTLCCVYIESLAQKLYDYGDNAANGTLSELFLSSVALSSR